MVVMGVLTHSITPSTGGVKGVRGCLFVAVCEVVVLAGVFSLVALAMVVSEAGDPAGVNLTTLVADGEGLTFWKLREAVLVV
jgi:hypothetical protein